MENLIDFINIRKVMNHMSVYKLSQWILIFFIYSFLGWIWESTFKSIKQKKLVNRGYLNGPWLPIYGFGAIIILYVTLPFKNDNLLIFILGMISASVFELVVGYVMEKLFHARYWDYTKIPFNIKGYIALPVSILWGFFSLILVNLIDAPVYDLVSNIKFHYLYVIDAFLLVLLVVDTILSTIQALDLKVVLNLHSFSIDNLRKSVDQNNNNISEKVLKKAEKIFKRNPSLLSNKHRLDKQEIKNIFISIKNQK